jgi:hypothetical protein
MAGDSVGIGLRFLYDTMHIYILHVYLACALDSVDIHLEFFLFLFQLHICIHSAGVFDRNTDQLRFISFKIMETTGAKTSIN